MSRKQKFSLLVIAGFLSLGCQSAFADTSSGNDQNVANTEQMLNQMSAQAAQLETQMNNLKKQIHQLKDEEKHLQAKTSSTQVLAATPGTMARLQQAPGLPPQSMEAKEGTPPVTYLSGTPVIIAPFIGDHSAFNASDLVINYSSYNQDLRLLQLRQGIFNQYCNSGIEPPTSPMLMLSGEIVGQGIYTKASGENTQTSLNLSAAELDFIPTIGPWASGFVSLKYDDSKLPNMPLTNNSNVSVDQGFMTFGNLNAFPLYMTLGQLYVPFGSYSSNLIAAPLTELVFQARERVFELGYEEKNGQGPYAQVYAFNGDADTGSASNINDGGINLGLDYSNNSWNVDAGVGAIADVADSLGMQTNGAVSSALMPNFTGFSSTASAFNQTTDILQHQVAGVAAHLNFGVGNFGVSSEYITATSDFSPLDMTYNGEGAKPQALHAEAYYNFETGDYPSAITLGYDQTWQALALNVPERRFIANYTISLWKDTIEELEYEHGINYSTGDTASGAGVVVPASQTGGNTNTVIAQFGVYF